MGSLSMQHESLRVLLRESPQTLPVILSQLLGHGIPKYDTCAPDDSDVTQLKPSEMDADLVLLLRRSEQPVMALVVEIQRAISAQKRQQWPLYTAALHARVASPPRFVPTALVVIATTERVANWAAKPISSFQPGSCFAPWVLGPQQVPRITDIEQAREQVELAVLSAMWVPQIVSVKVLPSL